MNRKNALLIALAMLLVAAVFGVTYPRRAARQIVPPAKRNMAHGLVIENGRELIDINRAGIDLLLSLPGVGQAMAESLSAGRPYDSVDDLSRAKGFGRKTIDNLRPYVTVGDDAHP